MELILSVCSEKEDSLQKLEAIRSLEPILYYFQTDLERDFQLSEAAKLLNLSVSRFSAVFKQIMGISPYAYRQDLRLREAYKCLLLQKCSVKEAAEMFGFTDEAHFSKTFQKYFRQTPASVLKQKNRGG